MIVNNVIGLAKFAKAFKFGYSDNGARSSRRKNHKGSQTYFRIRSLLIGP